MLRELTSKVQIVTRQASGLTQKLTQLLPFYHIKAPGTTAGFRVFGLGFSVADGFYLQLKKRNTAMVGARTAGKERERGGEGQPSTSLRFVL